MSPVTENQRKLLGAVLTALAIVPYLQTLGHDFVNYDDNLYVTENPHVLHGLTWHGLAWAFTTFKSGNWHPLTWISHMLDVAVWDGWAGGHHLTNVVLHAANTFLLFQVLLKMTGPGLPESEFVWPRQRERSGTIWRSALVAALFALHPLHAESVAWIAERKDVLSTFFGLLALGAYLTYTHQPSNKRYAIVCGWFVLSLMTKAMWVTLPFLLLLLDVWPLGRLRDRRPEVSGRNSGAHACVLEKIPLFVIATIFSAIAIISQRGAGNVAGLVTFPLSTRIATALVGYRVYIEKLVVPVNLAVFYPHPWHWPMFAVAISILVLSMISLVAIIQRNRYPWILVGWFWFLGTLVPVIGLVQIGLQSSADRYTYIPAIGIFIMIAWSIPSEDSPVARCLTATGLGGWLALLGTLTWIQVSYWQNSRTLFIHAQAVTRGNFIAHQNLGNVLEVEKHLDGALEQYERAAGEFPTYERIHENIANVFFQQGRYSEALAELKKAINLNPYSSTAFNSMGSIALMTNQYEDAAAELKRAVQLDPDNTAAHLNYGSVLVKLGRYDEAVRQLLPITRAEPKRVVARTNLARALLGRGDIEQAVSELRGILQIAPDYAPAREFLRQIENNPR
jgi:predicted negative regulator of RcsB-dependent stress response